MLSTVLILVLAFIAFLLWELAEHCYKAWRAAHPVIRVKGRTIQYRNKEH